MIEIMAMPTLVFVSTNLHKVAEMKSLLPTGYILKGLQDIGWDIEIPEPYNTFEENARVKTDVVFEATGLPCFADDSGLVVNALEGRPGVLSARYAGNAGDHKANMHKILSELEGIENRKARFIAVIAYRRTSDHLFLCSGHVEGRIATAPLGNGGFGYDPIFIPDGFDQTFGQLDASVKNRISHRAMAMRSFIQHLAL